MRSPQLRLGLSLFALAAFLPALSNARPVSRQRDPVPRPTESEAEPGRAISLETLRERRAYEALDEGAIERLARAAMDRWPEQFAGFEYRRVERFAAGGAAHWISIWLHERTGLEFALLPGGSFEMGSPSDEADRRPDESRHRVFLDPFLIARTECTRDAWAKVATAVELNPTPSYHEGSGRLPVESVYPSDVEAWCRAAGLMLPTEAQWEFACRAGTRTAWSMGSVASALAGFANLGSAECPPEWIEMGLTEAWHDGFGDQPSAAGSFAANAFGLFDPHGNVMEYCRDFYLGYDVPARVGTGLRAGESADRQVRGGNFRSPASGARSAKRLAVGPGPRNRDVGFRPALDLPMPVSLDDWAHETFPLPPSFAPALPAGSERLRFAPGYRDPNAPGFWSYAYVLSLDTPLPDGERVRELLDLYYDGLLTTFGRSAGRDVGEDPARVEIRRLGDARYEARLHVIDAFATFEPLDVRALVEVAEGSDGRAKVRVRISSRPPEHAIWRSLREALDQIEAE